MAVAKDLNVTVRMVPTWVQTSEAMVEDTRELGLAWTRWMNMTEEERAELNRQARIERAEERGMRLKPLFLGGLLERLGWSYAYGQHLVQAYCTCGPDDDGWYYCQHAWDLGLVPG